MIFPHSEELEHSWYLQSPSQITSSTLFLQGNHSPGFGVNHSLAFLYGSTNFVWVHKQWGLSFFLLWTLTNGITVFSSMTCFFKKINTSLCVWLWLIFCHCCKAFLYECNTSFYELLDCPQFVVIMLLWKFLCVSWFRATILTVWSMNP